MTRRDVPEIDETLATLVEVIDQMSPPKSEGPGVTLTLSGLVVSGRVIPHCQWFDDIEHASRAAFTVHTGGSIDDEHGGWATLFKPLQRCQPVASAGARRVRRREGCGPVPPPAVQAKPD